MTADDPCAELGHNEAVVDDGPFGWSWRCCRCGVTGFVEDNPARTP